MITAITGYPLSLDYRRALEEDLAAPVRYLHLPELRRLPPTRMARELATVGRRCVVPIEDELSYPLLPILETVAACSTARRLEIVHPDLRRERLSRGRAAVSLAAMVRASMGGQLALRHARTELRRLCSTPRADHAPGTTRRVAYANGNLWFGLRAGGSVGHIAGVLGGLVRAGFDVEYHAPMPASVMPRDVGFHRVAAPRSLGLPVEVNYYAFSRRMAAELAAALAESPPRFLYQRMSVANWAGVVACRHAGVPLVLEYNGSEVWVAEHWGEAPLRYSAEARLAEDVCLRHADLVVTVSDVLRDELLARGVDEKRIVSYPNCVDGAVFDPGQFGSAELGGLRESLGIPGDAVVATFVSTFGAWHGAETLARAVVRLVDEHGEELRRRPVRFLLVGDGVRLPAVRELLDRAPYRDLVVLTGLIPQEEAPRYLAASDVLVSPHVPNPDGSPFFGSPTKLFEYMAMGKGIVASRLDQIAAVLDRSLDAARLPEGRPAADERRLAVLATPGDEAQLAVAIRFLLERGEWRDALGANARREVLARYTWDDHVAAVLAGLERVAAA